MEESDQQCRDSAAHRLSRRKVLAATGVGALTGLAGCNSGDAERTASDTDAQSSASTATEPQTSTAEPTETKSVGEKLEEYGCPKLDRDPDIVVAKDGSGDYETVQAAIDALPADDFDENQVYIKEGVYEEKLALGGKLDVTLLGAGPEKTILTYDDHADKTNSLGNPIGTSGSASFVINGYDITLKDLTVRNDAEPVAQAVAARVDASRAFFVNCRFVGNQDTLYTRNENTNQYYKDCYIEGDVDFIFGAATAYFDGCEIFCKGSSGYATASSTEEGEEYGYVFNDCTITGDAPDDSFYLGRPWKRFAQTVFLNTEMGDHIRPEGYHPWPEPDHPDKTKTAYYAEYNNSGPGYTPDERVEWSHTLSESDAEPYLSPKTVLDGWDPTACL
ncbi:pectinesterase family protein [Haloarchaeobius sp. DYHT-AS-18]|uniref:pectinesterase family protein n=1 Tax=Haloarchaeobius sp. DYHT-AS-18 TaxID=3446117 RepID=UPI003EB80771